MSNIFRVTLQTEYHDQMSGRNGVLTDTLEISEELHLLLADGKFKSGSDLWRRYFAETDETTK